MTAKDGLQFTLKQNKRLFKIMTMRRRPAAGRNVHIDQAEPASGIFAGENDRVSVADNAQMRKVWILCGCNYQIAAKVVGRNR